MKKFKDTPRRNESTKKQKSLLSWDPKSELGFYPAEETWYNDGYFEAGKRNSESPIAKNLNLFRMAIVNKYTKGKVLDFGAGFGSFVFYRSETFGFDICEKSVWKLWKFGKLLDPYVIDLDKAGIKGVTFFDALEHLKDPSIILKRIGKQYVFISLPIFRDQAHVMASKHFKVKEHFWYFTKKSIVEFMSYHGFKKIECRTDEMQIGREDIYTYVFKR